MTKPKFEIEKAKTLKKKILLTNQNLNLESQNPQFKKKTMNKPNQRIEPKPFVFFKYYDKAKI